MTKGFVTTLTSTFNFLTMTKLKMTMDFDLILKISLLTLFGCAVKLTLEINPIYGQMDGLVLMNPKTCDNHKQRDRQINRLKCLRTKLVISFNWGKIKNLVKPWA